MSVNPKSEMRNPKPTVSPNGPRTKSASWLVVQCVASSCSICRQNGFSFLTAKNAQKLSFPFRFLGWVGFFLVLGTVLVTSGCSSREKFEAREKGLTAVITPRPPAFFTGPACVLLTNGGGYSARLTVQTEGLSERERNFSGQLLALGTKLLFAPDPSATAQKH